jgi:hypothetical protein
VAGPLHDKETEILVSLSRGAFDPFPAYDQNLPYGSPAITSIQHQKMEGPRFAHCKNRPAADMVGLTGAMHEHASIILSCFL